MIFFGSSSSTPRTQSPSGLNEAKWVQRFKENGNPRPDSRYDQEDYEHDKGFSRYLER